MSDKNQEIEALTKLVAANVLTKIMWHSDKLQVKDEELAEHHSDMDEIAEVAAKAQDRYVLAEQEPEKGYFFRSDHFNFAKAGVPALYAEGGYDHKEKGKEYAKQMRDKYTTDNYHRPSDEYDEETWNFDGMLQDGQLYFDIGLKLANSERWPVWYEGSEFKAERRVKG